MDAAIQLALIVKAKKVFGNDQTFLSFPVTPLAFTKQQLNFLADFNVANLQTFSLLVNQIPNGEAWLPLEQKYLWEIYDEILKQADFAISSRTSQEEVDYQAARNYLRTTKADGTAEDTPVYTIYKQYKDSFFLTQQKYLAAKSTAECSTDAAVIQQWQIDEPLLKHELTDCEKQWVLEGSKNEVETAQNTVFMLGGRSPLQTRTEWQTRFNADVDTITNAANLMSVYPSSFSPSNALEDGSWQPFKLTADEVKVMLAEAPEELRSRFAADSINPTLDSFTFEVSSAVIQRPWWVSDSFKARFWRFDDQSKVFSNGAPPVTGSCTAYVTAVVFARNLTITKVPAALQQTPDVVSAGFHFSFVEAFANKPDIRLQLEHSALINPLVGQDLRGASMANETDTPTLLANEMRQNFTPTETDESTPSTEDSRGLSPTLASMINSPVTPIAPTRRFDSKNLYNHPSPAPATHILNGLNGLSRDTVVTPVNQGSAFSDRAVFRALKNTTFSRIGDQATIPTPPIPLPPQVDPNIYILAFICKQVPQCPNPDPNLQW